MLKVLANIFQKFSVLLFVYLDNDNENGSHQLNLSHYLKKIPCQVLTVGERARWVTCGKGGKGGDWAKRVRGWVCECVCGVGHEICVSQTVSLNCFLEYSKQKSFNVLQRLHIFLVFANEESKG